ncbi:MAG: response regulator [Spirochaetales bacterium]|nr:response regulator [Spirochaetales bacterium]
MAKKIMVVDDSEMIRNFHCYALKSAGYEVISGLNGADAVEKLFTTRVDMIITDINMPVMDGYTLIETVRKEEDFKDIPIIIISTEDEAQDKQKGFDAGANLYLIKPVEPKKLIENVNMLLGD